MRRSRFTRRQGTIAEARQRQVGVVTGAASGIRQAYARRLAEDGARMVVADVWRLNESMRGKSRQSAGAALFVSCDVGVGGGGGTRSPPGGRSIGGCDILVDDAPTFKLQLFEMSFADWSQTLSINLDSAFLMCAASCQA